MTKVIVCTSINPPTEAIAQYDSMPDWTLVVVGDKKTPANYSLENGIYLSPDEQRALAPDLSEAIGWNCIQRRNFGFLVARQLNAELIAVVDDDNIPLDNWGTSVRVGQETEVTEFITDDPAFDPIGATNYPRSAGWNIVLNATSISVYSPSHRPKWGRLTPRTPSSMQLSCLNTFYFPT